MVRQRLIEIDPIKYMKDHKADYEDENVEVEKD